MPFNVLEKSTVVTTNILQAITWLSSSGIADPSGGCYAWYDPGAKEYAYKYAEITGYYLTCMCYLYKRSQQSQYLIQSEVHAKWLISKMQHPCGGFLCLLPEQASIYAHKQSQIYAFDTGIIINGLMHLYSCTQKEEYLYSAIRAAAWIRRNYKDNQGQLKSAYDVNRKAYLANAEQWSLTPGGYLSKVAAGLLLLSKYDLAGDWAQLATAICEQVLVQQSIDGRFFSHEAKRLVNLHPHCYATEGLWLCGTLLEEERYLAAAEQSVSWLQTLLEQYNMVPRLVNNDVAVLHQRVDILAQVLRLLVLYNDERKQQRVLEQILLYQQDNGAFVFGFQSDGTSASHCNSWVTMFVIQALCMLEDLQVSGEILYKEMLL